MSECLRHVEALIVHPFCLKGKTLSCSGYLVTSETWAFRRSYGKG